MNTDSNQFDNVLDLTASRFVKEKTGQVKPIKLDVSPTTESEEKHMDSVVRE